MSHVLLPGCYGQEVTGKVFVLADVRRFSGKSAFLIILSIIF